MKKEHTSFKPADENSNEDIYKLRLFVTGASPNSIRAIANLTSICEENIPQRYDLEIIDVYQQPSKTTDQQIIALPMLVKFFPLPLKRLIGDMSDKLKVLHGLGLNIE